MIVDKDHPLALQFRCTACGLAEYHLVPGRAYPIQFAHDGCTGHMSPFREEWPQPETPPMNRNP
jgi:hypothetical protein